MVSKKSRPKSGPSYALLRKPDTDCFPILDRNTQDYQFVFIGTLAGCVQEIKGWMSVGHSPEMYEVWTRYA